MVARPRLRAGTGDRGGFLFLPFLAQLRDQAVDADAGVPDVEVPELGEPAHRLAVGVHHRDHRRPACVGAELPASSRDLDAHREPLHVPLERPGQRLVEVVQIEDEVALGRAEAAEVAEVRVAAELSLEPRSRQRREVVGHDRGRSAMERERGDEHAPVPDRHELRDPGRRLRLEQGDRVAAARLEARVAPARAGLPRGPSVRGALLGRGVGGRLGGIRSTVA